MRLASLTEMHWGYDWVQLIELETSLGCLLDEKMAILKVLEMVQSSVRPKGMCLGKQKEIPKETSLVPASAESMAIQKVLMTEIAQKVTQMVPMMATSLACWWG